MSAKFLCACACAAAAAASDDGKMAAFVMLTWRMHHSV